MSSRLRLDLIVRRYPIAHGPDDAYGELWTWRLWAGSRIVSSSGSQRYSRRIDCARGAEVGANVFGVQQFLRRGTAQPFRYDAAVNIIPVIVRILDERTTAGDPT